MHTGLPYRPPAGGWSRPQFLGGCFQHWRRAEALIPVMHNQTQVANWLCEDEVPVGYPWSPSIMPYTRRSASPPSPQPNCTNYGAAKPGDDGWCDEGHAVHSRPPCGPWLDREFQRYTCDAPRQVVDLNCYELMPDKTKSLARCQKLGFKAVQAAAWWYGQHAFTSTDAESANYPLLEPVYALAAAPDGPKYRTLRWVAKYEEVTIIPSYTMRSINAAATMSIDRQSGIVTVTDNSYSYDGLPETEAEFIAEINDHCLPFATMTYAQRFQYGQRVPGSDPVEWRGEEPPTADWPDGYNYPMEGVGLDESEFSFTATTLHYRRRLWEGEFGHGTWTIDCELSDPYTASELMAECKSLLARVDMADDKTYPWRTDPWVTVNPLVTYDGVLANIGPASVMDFPAVCKPGWTDPNSETFTGAVRGEMTTGYYPMAKEDREYTETLPCPNQNASVTLALVPSGVGVTDVRRYNASLVLQFPLGEEDWHDYVTVTGADILIKNTGYPEEPLGNPMARVNEGDLLVVAYHYDADLGGHFDRRHINTRLTLDEGTGLWSVSEYFYGSYSGGPNAIDPTDSAMPHAATQWTPTNATSLGAFNAITALGPGAWVLMQPESGLLVMQKWAEIKLPWKSQNWFGPCGAQRDETTDSACAGDAETCDRVAGATKRWPDAWSIEGDRAATFSEPDAGTVTVTLAEAAEYLRVGDKVDVTDEAGTVTEDNGGAGFEITAANTTTEFEFAAATKPTGTRIKSHGAPGFWWYDTDGKGDFLFLRWHFNFRDYLVDDTIREDQVGLPRQVSDYEIFPWHMQFDRCFPHVLVCSPNNSSEPDQDPTKPDYFRYGFHLGFFEPTIDEKKGTRMQTIFRQATQDAYWRKPDAPCEWDGDSCGEIPAANWLEDIRESDATCAEDTRTEGVGDQYYAHRPMVEAFVQGDPELAGPVDGSMIPDAWIEGDTKPDAQDPAGGEAATVHRYALFDELTVGTLDGEVILPPYYDPDATPPVVGIGGCEAGEQCSPNVPDAELTPWIVWQWMQACICSDPPGRWAEDYERTLGCWMCGAEPTVTAPTVTVPDQPEAPARPAGTTEDGGPATSA